MGLGDSLFRAPGECVDCLQKSSSAIALHYQPVLAGETKLPTNSMSIVLSENLGLKDQMLKLALDDGSHWKIHDLDGDNSPRVFQGLKSAISVFAARSDGKLYACGLHDGGLAIIRTDNARLGLLRSWRSKNPVDYPVSQVAFLSSKVHVVSIDADRALSIWDLSESSEPIHYLPDIHSDLATCILPWQKPSKELKSDTKHNGKLEFLVGFSDGVCKKYTVKFKDERFHSLEVRWTMRICGLEDSLKSLGWLDSSNSKFVAAHGAYISVCTRENVLFAHQIHMSDISDMKCTATAIVTGSVDGNVKAISVDPDGWTLLQRIKGDCGVTAVVCDAANEYLGYADAMGKYCVYRISEGARQPADTPSKHQRRPDQPWGGRWEKLMNQHRYRESLIKASSTNPSDGHTEFRTAIRVLEALIECGLTEKAADGLTLEELCKVIESLTALLTDSRAFWCQPTVLIILKVVLATNSAWLCTICN